MKKSIYILLFFIFTKIDFELFASNNYRYFEDYYRLSEKDKLFGEKTKLLSYEDKCIISVAIELIESHKPYATRDNNITRYLDIIDSNIKNSNLTNAVVQKLNKIKSLINELNNDSFFAAQYAFDYFKDAQEPYLQGLRIRNDTFQVYEKLKQHKNKQLIFSDIGFTVFLIQALDNPEILGIQERSYDSNSYYKNYSNSYNKYNYSNNYNNYDYKDESKRLQIFGNRSQSFKLQMKVIDYFLKNCPTDTAFITRLSGFQKELEYKEKFESPLEKAVEIFSNFITFQAGKILNEKINLSYKEFFDTNKPQNEMEWRNKNKVIKILSPRYPWEEKILEDHSKTPKKPKEKNILDKSKDELNNHIDKTKKEVANQLTNKAEQVIDDTVNSILNSILGSDKKSSTGATSNILKGILGG